MALAGWHLPVGEMATFCQVHYPHGHLLAPSGRGPTTALCGGDGIPMPCPGVGVVGVVCTGQRRASARSCSPLAFLILACVLSHLYPALRLGRWIMGGDNSRPDVCTVAICMTTASLSACSVITRG